jgi:hypothetical protein
MDAAAIQVGRSAIKRRSLWTFRAADWWEFKLSPLLAIFYGAALGRHAALLPLVPQALLLLAAVALCAAFVSAINDVSDLGVDARAGKANPMAGRSAMVKAATMILPALGGLAIAFLWRRNGALALAYLGSYGAFILYSLPPARLKVRGAFGVAADAAGAHLFPTLTAILLASQAMRAAPDAATIAAGAVWGLAFGLRGILWHQLGDVDADGRAGISTLARRHTSAALARVGTRVLLPAEVVGLLLLLWRMDAALGCLALACYVALLRRLFTRAGIAPAIVRPQPGAAIALHDYYGVWLPAAVILQSALRHPADMVLLALHLLLFPVRARQSAAAVWRALRPGAPR